MAKLQYKNHEIEGSVPMLIVAWDYAHQLLSHSHLWMKRDDGKWECACGIVLSDEELASARAWAKEVIVDSEAQMSRKGQLEAIRKAV